MGVVVFRLIYLFTAIDFQRAVRSPISGIGAASPDWCYYELPMIGWLMGLVRVLFGYKWWALRLGCSLGTCSMVMLFVLGRTMFNARVGFFAAVMLLCSPANMAANFLFTVDGPLVVWVSALVFFWQAAQAPEFSMRWVWLTLAIGFGTLTKQMMLVFPVLMILFAALVPAHKGLLKRPAFWLSIAGSLLFLTPPLWWNYQHNGVTFSHMTEHFHHDDVGILGTAEQVLRFPVLQSVLYSPLTWGVGLCTCGGAVATGRRPVIANVSSSSSARPRCWCSR